MRHEMLGSYANVWIRQKLFTSVGDTSPAHKHKYDHLSILAKGSIKVTVEGKTKIFTAPTFIVVRADKAHELEALEEDTLWYCVFASRDINGNVYDPEKNDPLDEACHGFEENFKGLEDISIDTLTDF